MSKIKTKQHLYKTSMKTQPKATSIFVMFHFQYFHINLSLIPRKNYML